MISTFARGRWFLVQESADEWYLEDNSGQLGLLRVTLSATDLLDLKATIESAEGKEDCPKCLSPHPQNEHHPLLEKWMRSLADYDNLLKRNKQENQQTQFDVSKRILTELLLLMDNIRIVVLGKTVGTPLTAAELQIVTSSLDTMLSKNEVTPLFPNMQPSTEYNPDYHQAIEVVAGDETKVVPLMQGYLWRDKVLRPAQVRVVRKQ